MQNPNLLFALGLVMVLVSKCDKEARSAEKPTPDLRPRIEVPADSTELGDWVPGGDIATAACRG